MTAKRLPMSKATTDGPWYRDGIRFECQRSNRCCTNHGEYAYVYVTPDEERRIAEHLGLTLGGFRKQHTVRDGAYRCLKSVNDACGFLLDGGCSIHEVKPTQCRTWPFWTNNLDPAVWERDVAPFCPGVGKGPLYTREQIEAIAAEHDASDENL